MKRTTSIEKKKKEYKSVQKIEPTKVGQKWDPLEKRDQSNKIVPIE